MSPMQSADLKQPASGWHTLTHPRLTPPPPAARGVLFRGLSLLAKRFGRNELPVIFPVLNIHRGLFPAWLWFASRLMPYGNLAASVRELLILRTAWNCRCRYEWGQHLELGLRVGLNDMDILFTTDAPEKCPDAIKRLLLEICDELFHNDTLSEPTWQALRAHWSESDSIEILMLIGHYRMLAGFLNSVGLVLEAPVEQCVAAFWQRQIRAHQ